MPKKKPIFAIPLVKMLLLIRQIFWPEEISNNSKLREIFFSAFSDWPTTIIGSYHM